MAVNAASGTSTYVNNASSSKGFSGLASGVDTESMVEQLLSGTQSKIDKQEGLKQQIQWKQEIYRNIISQINAFQSKFFSFSSSTNLSSSSFWNSLSVFANSSAFRATAASTASPGTSSISVRRLATKTSVTSGKAVSGDLSGKLDVNAFRDIAKEQLDGDYNVQFQVGSTTVDVDLKSVFVQDGGKGFKEYTTTELDSALQKKLQDAFNDATSGVTVTVTDGQVSIVGTGISKNITVTAASGEWGLQRLGLSAGESAAKNSDNTTGTLTSTVDAVPTMDFAISLDDVAKTVSVDLRKVIKNDSIDVQELKNQLQQSIEKVHGAGQIKVEFGADNSFSLKIYTSTGKEDIGRKMDIYGAEDVMSVLGMKSGQSNRVSLGATLGDLNLSSSLRGDDYRFTINGVEFHFTSDTAVIDVMDAINRSAAGVRMTYRAQDDKFVLETKEYGAGKEITMAQSEGNFLNAFFGGNFKVGSVAAKNLEDFEPVDTKGKTFKLPVGDDGEPKKADEVTLAELGITKLGDLDVNTVKLSELSSSGKYYYGTDSNGNITILQRLDANTKLADMGLKLDGYENYALAALERATGGKLVYKGGKLILNGYFAREGAVDAETVKSLDELFGKGVAIGYEDGDTVTAKGFGDFEPAATKGMTFDLQGKSLDEIMVGDWNLPSYLPGVDPFDSLEDLVNQGKYYFVENGDGTVTLMQKPTADTTLAEMGLSLNGRDDLTLADLEEFTEGKLVFQNGQLTLTGYYAESADAATTATLNALFGEGVALGKLTNSGLDIVMGQNAEVEVDGIITERASNNFTINGVNYDVTDITGKYSDVTWFEPDDGSAGYYVDENGAQVAEEDLVMVDGKWKKFTGDAVNVTIKQDTDTIINGIKEFIDEYNVLVKTLNDLLDEDTNYRDYQPLTSAQKAEMSEREIELWEQKAKEGLLHNDSTIQSFLQQMRTALYQKPAGAPYALYELGIETGEWEMKGQLSFVVGGEAQLRNMLENDPSGVASLFTGVNGLATTLNEILQNTASTSSGSPGTLVQIAGVKGNDTNSSMYDQMKRIDEKIAALKRTYEMEKTRYWKQFNTMEQLISNMNTQSAYLAQMMGMNY